MAIASRRTLPNFERLSIVAALIAMDYILAQFISLPERSLGIQLPGFYLEIVIGSRVISAVLAGVLTASGADWLIRDHPAAAGSHPGRNAILPAFMAIVIGLPLSQLPFNSSWWAGLIGGTVALVIVILGEYIALDLRDARHPLVAAGLTAAAYAMFVILVSSLHEGGMRLFLLVPLVSLAAWMVSLRVLHLRQHGEWLVIEAAIIALLVGEVATALHYWPLEGVDFGLTILGVAYALTSLFNGMIEKRPLRELLMEPAIALVLAWGAAWVIS